MSKLQDIEIFQKKQLFGVIREHIDEMVLYQQQREFEEYIQKNQKQIKTLTKLMNITSIFKEENDIMTMIENVGKYRSELQKVNSISVSEINEVLSMSLYVKKNIDLEDLPCKFTDEMKEILLDK